MKKALTIGLVGAALAATLSFVAASLKSESPVVSEAKAETEAAPEPANIVLAQNTASVLNYERGPRIIIVPQAGDRLDRGNSRASIERDLYEDDDDIASRRNAAPPVRATPRWAPRTETPLPRRVETPAKPRTETRTVRHIDMSRPKPKAELKSEVEAPIPQPPSPRRAVLSAPPMPAEGPSPIRPTPRFDAKAGAKAEASVKPAEPPADLANDSPPPGEITADSPPPGYTPPAAPMRHDEFGNKY